ncbi:hypothetical protein CLOSTMETH_02132 [[Clostridium] methylpentosum DSM 5476]|uniref:Uncharacterized protein n=1 Tax=[Clostridium] methylpentosum DSM 5476 TaxID=537013 RepID=C0EE53_9FIRM|nr:hypothetical protein CLOSTMETH_02132 [[Clostridium] methylpentosum DSM 5476]
MPSPFGFFQPGYPPVFRGSLFLQPPPPPEIMQNNWPACRTEPTDRVSPCSLRRTLHFHR